MIDFLNLKENYSTSVFGNAVERDLEKIMNVISEHSEIGEVILDSAIVNGLVDTLTTVVKAIAP